MVKDIEAVRAVEYFLVMLPALQDLNAAQCNKAQLLCSIGLGSISAVQPSLMFLAGVNLPLQFNWVILDQHVHIS